jgi:hypothetical protein
LGERDEQPEIADAMGAGSAGGGEAASPSGELTAEVILNAAVAFAGHVATAAQQATAPGNAAVDAAIRDAIVRQYLLETATLCLRRLGESYASAAGDPAQAPAADLLRDGAERAAALGPTVEALGDLGLDLLDRLLG